MTLKLFPAHVNPRTSPLLFRLRFEARFVSREKRRKKDINSSSSSCESFQIEDVLKEEVTTNEAIGGRGRHGYSGRRKRGGGGHDLVGDRWSRWRGSRR